MPKPCKYSRMSRQVKRIEKACEECGHLILITTLENNRRRGRFCSARCLGLSNARKMNAVHPRSDEWRDKLRKAFHPSGEQHPQFVRPLIFTCKNCNANFTKKPWQVRRKGCTSSYCSSECRNHFRKEHQSGKASPFWTGGVSRKRGALWHITRKLVVKRQNGNCASCKKHIGHRLAVHHVIPFREWCSAIDANHISNLIGLCQSCHMRLEWRKTQQSVCDQSQHKTAKCHSLQISCSVAATPIQL